MNTNIWVKKSLYLEEKILSSWVWIIQVWKRVKGGNVAKGNLVWTDGWNKVYTYSGIIFSLKKTGSSDICDNMDRPCGHYAKWNKPVTKWQIQ